MKSYILDDDNNVIEATTEATIKWLSKTRGTDRKRVALTNVAPGVKVSTVFLGVDHQWGDGPPLVFESLAFGVLDDEREIIDRYSTWDEAVAGHEAMVNRVKELVSK